MHPDKKPLDGLEALKHLLSCVIADGSQVAHVILEEKDPSAKLKKLIISELASGMLVLATDEGTKNPKYQPCVSPLFAQDGKCPQNRICDAVLIKKDEPEKNGYTVFYIELKSDNPGGYTDQFKSTRCFFHYVIQLAKEFCAQEINITKERYIVFHTDPSSATPKNHEKASNYLSPQKANSKNTADAPKKFRVKNGWTVRYTEFF
ncbi:MAG: hypothetical protein QM520_02435 [Gammaproteobacteria bacterium]|nr:hypothetical protein [Gammaproteobacteria bacterium]